MDRTQEGMILKYQASIPKYTHHDGIPFPGLMMTDSFAQIENFEVRDTDILIAGYPRSGNHWIKEIVSQLCDDMPLSNKHVSERIPILEFSIDLQSCVQTYIGNEFKALGPISPLISKVATQFGLVNPGKCQNDAFQDPVKALTSRTGPRVYHTHLPFKLAPKGIREGQCKTIYVMRNGKDVATSFYEMHKMYPPFGYYSGDFREFMAAFSSGKVCFGSWFNHVNDWWAQRKTDTILYVNYEDMIEDLPREIKRVAKFLEKDLSENRLSNIVGHCTFKSMQKNPNATYDGLHDAIDTKKTTFLRRGKVSDWKARMTVEDSEIFDKVFKANFIADHSPEIRFQI